MNPRLGGATGQYHEGFRKGINRKSPTPSLLDVPTALSGLRRSSLKRFKFELPAVKLSASLYFGSNEEPGYLSLLGHMVHYISGRTALTFQEYMDFLRRAKGKMATMEGDIWELPEHM